MVSKELLLSEEENDTIYSRYAMILYGKSTKEAESNFWTTEEIDLTRDKRDWDSLTKNERYFIEMTLAFFAGSDGIVNENLVERFMKDVQLLSQVFLWISSDNGECSF